MSKKNKSSFSNVLVSGKSSFRLFFYLLIRETPNIIQIIGFPSLFIILFKTNLLITKIISLLTSGLLVMYLMTKSFDEIIIAIRDPLSNLNRKKLDIQRVAMWSIIYTGIIGLTYSIMVALVGLQ